MVRFSKCIECKHYHRKRHIDLRIPITCDAFPLRIPSWHFLYSITKICNNGIGYEPATDISYDCSRDWLVDDIYAEWPQGIIMMGLTEEEATELEKTIQVKIWK